MKLFLQIISMLLFLVIGYCVLQYGPYLIAKIIPVENFFTYILAQIIIGVGYLVLAGALLKNTMFKE